MAAWTLFFSAGWFDEVDEWGGLNLVYNPSFELVEEGRPIMWRLPDGGWSIDEEVRRTGRRSLRYENDDPNVYRLIIQKIDLKPGRRYAVVAWVKTEGVEGEGAGVCVEWTDEEGRWLGGVYPGCVSGTSDWRPVGTIFRVPEEAGGREVRDAQVVLYMRKGSTGRAWFDDVQVREMIEPTVRAVLLRPGYRGIVRAGEPAKVELEVRALKGGELEFVLERKRIGSMEIGEGAHKVAIDLPPLKKGKRTLTLNLRDRQGERIGYDSVTLSAVPEERLRGIVYVDDRRRLIVGGEPFFPIGIYLGPTEEEHLRRLAEAGFNTVLCYGYGVGPDPIGYMDRAGRLGLKVIYSIKDLFEGTAYFPAELGKGGDELVEEYVRMLRGHPALLAWYINDELGLEWLPKLKERYELVSLLDPNHPALQALCRPAEFGEYFETLDVIGPDPYPIPRHPVTMVADWVEEAVEAMRSVKPVWAILQIFSWRVYSGREEDRDPTYDEMRCMTYLALIHGATGVLYYSYYDLFTIDRKAGLKASKELFEERFDRVRRVVGELRKLAQLILSGDPVDLDVEPKAVHVKGLKLDDKLFILAANAGGKRAKLKIRLPNGIDRAEPLDLNGNPRGRIEEGTLTDTLEPLECVTYEVRP